MSLGDDEHPISFLFEPELRGGHVHVTVRCGQRPQRAIAGTLVLRWYEWAAFRDLLGQSAPVDPTLESMLRYAPIGAESRFAGVKLVHFDEEPIEVVAEYEGRAAS